MSAMDVPATRTLARVLRQSLAPAGDPLQLFIGVGAAPPSGATANGYARVTIAGQTLTVPKLKGAPQPAVGAPAYLLAGADFLVYIGTVSLTP